MIVSIAKNGGLRTRGAISIGMGDIIHYTIQINGKTTSYTYLIALNSSGFSLVDLDPSNFGRIASGIPLNMTLSRFAESFNVPLSNIELYKRDNPDCTVTIALNNPV